MSLSHVPLSVKTPCLFGSGRRSVASMNMKKIGTLSAVVALSFGLAACSSDEAEQTIGDAQTAVSEAADDAASAMDDAMNDDGATDTTDTAAGDRSADGAQSAREAALSVVSEAGGSDGVVVSQDWDDDGYWEIDVVADNTKHELKVKGTEVIDHETDDVDDADRAAASASVSIDDAIATALESTPGQLDDAEFDDGRWEIEIDTTSDSDVEVYVDAETGDILK